MKHRGDFERTIEEVSKRRGWSVEGGRVEVALADGRRQGITLEYFEFEATGYVRLLTIIGSARRIDAMRLTEALRLNYGLPHGSMALKGDDLVMVDTLRLGEADPGEIEAAVAYLAETADGFEQSIFGKDQN